MGGSWKGRKFPCVHCHKLGPEGEWCDCEQAQADMREWNARRARPFHISHMWSKAPRVSDDKFAAAFCAVCGWRSYTVQASEPCDGGAHLRSVGVVLSVDLPDPIAEFNERRKAKREASQPDDVWQRFDAYQKEDRRQLDLARAMSTPLPHDPDMHTRLMPWRGRK